MKHTLLFLFMLLLGFGTIAEAQTGQIVLHPGMTMLPDPSCFISDWQSNPRTIMLSVPITEPATAGSYSVKLMAEATRNGEAIARTNPSKMGIITFHLGANTFNAADIVPINAIEFPGAIDQSYKRLGRLPEGNYSLCVWFINAETNLPIPGSACCSFTIQSVQPPMLISPANGAQFTQQPIPTELAALSLQSCQPITINDLLRLDAAGIANLKSFDIISGNNHNYYYFDPKITERDSAEAMKIQVSLVNPNDGKSANSRMEEDEVPFRRFLRSHSGNNTISQDAASINFSWLPPMPLPQGQVQYRLRVVEVLPGQAAGQALQSAAAVIDKDRIPTTYASLKDLLTTDIIDLLFSVNSGGNTEKQFAWFVQAHDAGGNPLGQNNGWSIPGTFAIMPVTNTDPPDPDNFFDIYFPINRTTINSGNTTSNEPCPYTYRYLIGKFYTPCVNGHRDLIEEWGIFTCSLLKGHSGPHHGTVEHVYLSHGGGDCVDMNDRYPTHPIPPGGKIIKEKDLKKIPTREEADKKEADEKKASGGNNGGQSSSENSGSNGTGASKIAVQPEEQGPCPYTQRSFLRTVAGSWRLKKDSKESHSVSFHPTGGTWAGTDAVWERDIWNVYSVKHCTLLKGHSGAHKLDAGSEEFEKKITITAPVHYDIGEDQVPPKDSSDGLPQEDPK